MNGSGHFVLNLTFLAPLVDSAFFSAPCPRDALWKQRELITVFRNPQEDPERGPLSVVMETDAGSLPGEVVLSSTSLTANIKQQRMMMAHSRCYQAFLSKCFDCLLASI